MALPGDGGDGGGESAPGLGLGGDRQLISERKRREQSRRVEDGDGGDFGKGFGRVWSESSPGDVSWLVSLDVPRLTFPIRNEWMAVERLG